MNLARSAYRALNQTLGYMGFHLQPLKYDFDDRVENPRLRSKIFSQLANIFDDWLSHQRLYDANPVNDSTNHIEQLYEAFLRTPFRNIGGGSRFNNLVWLSLIVRSYDPTVIIDSGTFMGASAWALAFGAPNVPIFSFDVDLSRLRQRVAGVQYIECDWSTYNFGQIDFRRPLAYFDDHVDQAKRIIEASERGVGFAIFDDDYPVTSFAENAHNGFSLPKIEMLFDEELQSETTLEWTSGNLRRSWIIPHEHMKMARQRIQQSERLPNSSLVTGFHQTPYKLVKLAKA